MITRNEYHTTFDLFMAENPVSGGPKWKGQNLDRDLYGGTDLTGSIVLSREQASTPLILTIRGVDLGWVTRLQTAACRA
jgi:hypothetical protein